MAGRRSSAESEHRERGSAEARKRGSATNFTGPRSDFRSSVVTRRRRGYRTRGSRRPQASNASQEIFRTSGRLRKRDPKGPKARGIERDELRYLVHRKARKDGRF